MSKDIEYFIDGKAFVTAKPELTVAEMLLVAGVSAAQFYIVSKDGVEYLEPGKRIEIHEGDQFETRKRRDSQAGDRVIHYKVNGEEQTTKDETLTVEMILRNAGAAASIDVNQIDSYILENITDGRKYENIGEQVVLKDGDQFLAVHTGRTPVA